MRNLLFLLPFILITQTLRAQADTLLILPESNLVDGSIIEPYTNKWKVTFVNSEGKETPNKIWSDYGQIINLNGKQYYHRVQDLYDLNMNLLDTWINMSEHKTLIPLSFSTFKPNGRFSYYQFNGSLVEGSTNIGTEDSTKSIDAKLPASVYDWNLYGMLLVGLPLKEGLIAKLPFYNSQSNDLNWLIINVEAKKSTKLPNGKSIQVWKVMTNQRLTFWVSKSAPYVVKLELYLKDNAKLVWDVI